MDKQWMSVGVIMLLLAAMVPLSLAEEGSDRDSLSVKLETEGDVDDSGGAVKTDVNTRLRAGKPDTKTDTDVRTDAEVRDALAARMSERVRLKIRSLAEISDEEREKLERLPRAVIDRLPDDPEQLKTRLAEIRIAMKTRAEAFKVRVLADERLELARERWEAAKDRYANARERHQEMRDRFDEWAEKERELCEDEESSECQEARENALENAKERLTELADMMLSRLDELAANVESNENLDEATAETRLEAIAEMKVDIERLKEVIADAETKEDVKVAGKELIALWANVKVRATVHLFDGVGARLEGLVQRAEHLEQRMNAALDKLADEGDDVSELDAKVDAFSELVLDAKAEIREADAILAEVKADGEVRGSADAAKEAAELLRSAHQKLKEAHGILKEFVRALNALGEGLEDDDDVIVVEDDDDDEDDSAEDLCENTGGRWKAGPRDCTGTSETNQCPPTVYLCFCSSGKFWNDDSGCGQTGTQDQLCYHTGGNWREFANSCGDSCELARNAAAVSCAQVVTDACDCGSSKCWNGSACEYVTRTNSTLGGSDSDDESDDNGTSDRGRGDDDVEDAS